MSFETFRGRNVEEALAAVKTALGPNAIIESTRHVRRGSDGPLTPSFFEVVAAPGARGGATPFSRDVGRGSMPAASQARHANRRRPVPLSADAVRAELPFGDLVTALPSLGTPAAPSHASHPMPALFEDRTRMALDEELRSIRSLLEQLAQTKKPRDRAAAALAAAGIDEPLVSRLLEGSGRPRTNDATGLRAWLSARLAQAVRVAKDPLEAQGPHVIACVGPTGVGKTTTIAKLAARAHFELGRSVSIITLDTFRVGAVEQIKRFAELMGISCDVAKDRTSFSTALAARRSDLTLVDTSGAVAS